MSVAESQAGVADNPSNSDCNPYTAYWGDGSASGCANGLRRNAWCADFAAWAWRQAGVSFTYGFSGSDINAWSASFYFWGLATGNWHPLSSGYQPQPGDAAVYGNLIEASGPGHVGIYVGGPASNPTVVNGNWAVNWPKPRNYGVVEQSNESSTGVPGGGLDGYVSVPNQTSGGGTGPGGGPSPGAGPGGSTGGTGGGGGGPIVGVLNGSNFNVKQGISGQWNLETTGASSIAVADGPDGPVIVTDNGGDVYAKQGISGQWNLETQGASAVAVADGSGGPIIVTDNGGDVYAKQGISGQWTLETQSASALAIADS